MYCAYCGVEHDETTLLSDEHIVPYAIGGPADFTIRVCEFSNNRLGGQVDRPVIEYDPVRSERFFFGLEGTDGTPPTLNLSGTGYIQGKEVDLRYVVGPEGKDMRITSREITKTPTEDGERWGLSGSPEAIRKALAGKIKSQEAVGKWVKNDRGEVVTLDNLDQVLQEGAQEFINPSVLRKIDFNYLWTWRFFSKLALAAGHYFFGNAFSSSERANVLRMTMNAQTVEQIELPGVAIFPETHSVAAQLAPFKAKGKHTIVVAHGQPRILMVSLFGWLDACITLDNFQGGASAMRPGNMEVVEIKLPSRKWSRYSFAEYVSARS